MKKFFSFIIRQSVAVILIVVFVLAFGVYSTLNMAINLLPDMNIPMVCVQIIYPGANAQSVETDVTKKLEEGLSSISGVTGVDSYSYDNVSAVVLSFDYGTETSEKKNDIRSKLGSLDLPEGITPSVYDIDLNAEALAVLSVTSGEGATEDERLKNAYTAAQELETRLAAIDGVERVELKGGAEVSYLVSPIEGLELISPLIVQAFSYGGLDLPLGNLTQDGTDVQIRNNSDIKSEDDIYNTPLELPSSLVTLFTAVKQVMRYYEDATTEDLQKLDADLSAGVLYVLRELDGMTAYELDDLSKLKTYMNIANSYTAEQLKSFKRSRYYNEIYNRVTVEREDGTRVGKTDEELEELLTDIKESYPALASYLSADMLKVVRDGKIDTLIDYRENYVEVKPDYNPDLFYELTADDYFVLESGFVKVYDGVYDYETDREEVNYRIDFARKTSATGLKNIADKKRDEGDGYIPTDGECALLFAGTELSSEHPVITSSTFIAFVRSENYPANMAQLIEKRGGYGGELSAEEWFEVYSALNLTGVFEYGLSERLFAFIIDTDFGVLTSGGGKAVKIKDVASVTIDENFNSYVYFGDSDARIIKGTVVEIYKSNGANSSAVVREVKAVYAQFLEEKTMFGAKITLLDDQSEFISDSISNVLVSMLIGGALAIFIIFVFLKRVRTSLIIAITMPLSVLAALVCLSLMGITLNMVSLGGLAVGIGMLVDNSIVVIESISKHRDMDKSAFEAAVDGTVEVGGALFGSTLTTVCVFIPIIFSGGLTAEIFTDLSWAVIFSLTFSLIVALSVIPSLYALFGSKKRMLKGGKLTKSLSPESAKTQDITGSTQISERAENVVTPDICHDKAQNAVVAPDICPDKRGKTGFWRKLAVLRENRIMDAITSLYGKILPAVIGKKAVTILTAVVVFGASIGLLFLTGTEFLPSIDKGQIEISMSYGANADLDDVQSDVFAFAERVREEVDNIDYLSVSVGKNGLLALTDTGIIKVQLTTNRGTAKVVEKIRSLAEQTKKPSRSVAVKEIDGVVASLMSGSSDLSVTIVGDDGETLKKIAGEVKAALVEDGFIEVSDSSTETAVEYDLNFDRNELLEYGLDYQTLVLTLRIGIASYTACTVKIDGEEFGINVKFAEGALVSTEDLENFVVGADGDGKAVKLIDVCEITRTQTEACIRRSGGKQMVSVSAVLTGTDTGTASDRMRAVAGKVLSDPDYAGYTFEESGISSYLNDAFEGLAVALVISFFLLFAVMAVQFSSAVKPLIVMASIPFSFTGGFIALVITGTSLNVVSFIGLIMLMGVVVNNAIVMLEKIKQLTDEGMDGYFAVQEACKVRLRPILMTTLTTILALIPLAVGVGQGSELMQPLGIVVIGGLLIGTLVTLLIVPTVYCAVKKIKRPQK